MAVDISGIEDVLPYYSHTVVTLADGKEIREFDMACYSHLWRGCEGMERLHLLFPEHEVEKVDEYVNWVLTSDLFGEAFITKTYEEGIAGGFEVNIHLPTNFLFSAMAALRLPWEGHYQEWGETWHYHVFRNLGFSVMQSFYLTTQAEVGVGRLVPNSYNSNHLPIPRHIPFQKYSPEFFDRQVGTMYERASSAGVTNAWEADEGMWEGDLFHRLAPDLCVKDSFDHNDENVNSLKERLNQIEPVSGKGV